MSHQKTGPFLQSQFRVLLLYFLLHRFCRGQSQLIGSSQPITAVAGGDVILPCHLEPARDVSTSTVEWTRPDLEPRFIHLLRSGQELTRVKNSSYNGRTLLFVEELKHGNISLKLSKVKPADEGMYRCFIPDRTEEAFVELVLASAPPCPPVISLSGMDRDRGGVVLQCESRGWYPEPEVLWLDAEGNLLSAEPPETVRGPDDLYTVSSRVTVDKRHNNSFTCRVQQNNIHQTREAHIHVPDDFFFNARTSSTPLTVGLAISLAVCILLLIVAVVLFIHMKRQNTFRTEIIPKNDGVSFEKAGGVRRPLMKDRDRPPENEQKLKKMKSEQEEEAENRGKSLKEELDRKNKETETKRDDLLQLREEKERTENELKPLKEQLERQETERKKMRHSFRWFLISSKMKTQMEKPEDEESFRTLKTEVETKETELHTKEDELIRIEAELQQLLDDKDTMEEEVALNEVQLMIHFNFYFRLTLVVHCLTLYGCVFLSNSSFSSQLLRICVALIDPALALGKWWIMSRQKIQEEIQRMTEEAQSNINILKAKSKEEKQRRQDAEKEVKSLKSQLESVKNELEEQKQKTAEEQKKREAAESKVKRLQSQLDSMNCKNNN